MNWAWIDLETTGLDPVNDSVLEIGIIVTDIDLNEIASQAWVIAPGEDRWTLRRMDDVVREMHTANGLLAALEGGIEPWVASDESREFIQDNDALKSPMCGSTVHFDRSMLKANMRPLLEAFSYRNIDVSTIKELSKAWLAEEDWWENNRDDDLPKEHRSLSDLRHSIAELQHYSQWFRVWSRTDA